MTELARGEPGGAIVLEPAGRLDALAAPQLEQALAQALGAGQPRLLVDFSAATYISSSCLRVLLLGARRARAAGGDLMLCCLPARIQRVLALAGFDQIFELWSTREAALQAYASRSGEPGRP